MATLFPFPSSKARIRAMSSANWSEVPGGKGVAPMVSKLETIAYPTLLFSIQTKLLHQCTRFPQNWSEDLLTILLGVLPNGPKFMGKSEREDCGAIILPKDGFEHFLLYIFETWLPSSGPLQPLPSGMPTAHLPLCPSGALRLTPGLSQGGPATYRLTRLNPDTVLLLTPSHTVPLVSDSLKP